MSETKVCIECNKNKEISLYRKGRNQCKECCKLKSKCIHNRIKSSCKDCGGASICEHNKLRSHCKECGGKQICEHNKLRCRCKECKGSSICEHNKIRSRCKICEGGQICKHNKIRYNCKQCTVTSFCIHNRYKSQCKECGGTAFCIHNKRKSNCIDCNPSCSCIECKNVYSDKRSLCHPYCQACFCNKYPDHENSTLYKIKERYLRDELRERFPNLQINMVFDKVVEGGCSNRKPDIFIELLTYSIIIECDENQHKNYECENKRTMQLFEDLGNRPLILIRFNPDGYTKKNKEKEKGCFKPLISIDDVNRRKFYDINNIEWKRRVDVLEKVIHENISIDTFPAKEVTEIKLFYDNFD